MGVGHGIIQILIEHPGYRYVGTYLLPTNGRSKHINTRKRVLPSQSIFLLPILHIQLKAGLPLNPLPKSIPTSQIMVVVRQTGAGLVENLLIPACNHSTDKQGARLISKEAKYALGDNDLGIEVENVEE